MIVSVLMPQQGFHETWHVFSVECMRLSDCMAWGHLMDYYWNVIHTLSILVCTNHSLMMWYLTCIGWSRQVYTKSKLLQSEVINSPAITCKSKSSIWHYMLCFNECVDESCNHFLENRVIINTRRKNVHCNHLLQPMVRICVNESFWLATRGFRMWNWQPKTSNWQSKWFLGFAVREET